MVQATRRTRKQRIDSAIAYALDRRWDLAAAENQALLAEFPDDIESANRLGKALTELGDLDEARKAYQRTLELDSTNVIARRNLSRIEEMRGSQPRRRTTRRASAATTAAAPAETVRPHSLIEESGKSAEFDLLEADLQALRRVSAGDPAELVVTPRGVSVQAASGAILGHIEPRAGLRLKRLIDGGNRYAVVIRRVGEDSAAIYVRETYRAPALADQPSFLPPATSARKRLAPRAYTKASIVRYQADGGDVSDETEDEERDSGWTPRSRRTQEDEFEDSGFSDDDSLSDDDDDDSEELAVDDEDEPIVDEDDEEM
jgi:tetratricopeptide (TPR) repeat protein